MQHAHIRPGQTLLSVTLQSGIRACTAAFPWPSITGILLTKQRLKDQIKKQKTEIRNGLVGCLSMIKCKNSCLLEIMDINCFVWNDIQNW
jgi:hypothetical protein